MISKKIKVGFLTGLGLAIILALLFTLGVFKNYEERLADNFFYPRPADPRIVIIAIDNKSLSSLGKWPWKRSLHAKLLQILDSETFKPKVIGIDISFLELTNTQEDYEFKQAIAKAGNIVLAAEVDQGKILKPQPIFLENAKFGITNTISGSDGITRKIYPENHFSTVISETLLSNISLKTEDNLLRINFSGKPGSFKSFSYIDVLEGNIPPREFKDKIVLVGVTAPDLHDNQLTPLSGNPMPGVEIQANTIQTLLERKFLVRESKIQSVLVIILITILLSTALNFLNITLAIVVTLIIGCILVLFDIRSFDQGIIRGIIYPLLATFTAFVANLVYKYFSEYQQKQFIKKAFSHYLSQPILKELINNPQKLSLGGEKKELTVLFSDVARFTAISEKLEPQILSSLMNNYLSKMTNIIFANKGVLDKFIGDGIMAFWGAPIEDTNHAYLACKSALEMQEEVKKIEKIWQQENIAEFKIRIGINTGEVVVGNMGSNTRFDYTALGDNVNIASRLEGLNKEYKTQILISENTFQKVKTQFKTRKLGRALVKGKTKSLTVYELLGFKV